MFAVLITFPLKSGLEKDTWDGSIILVIIATLKITRGFRGNFRGRNRINGSHYSFRLRTALSDSNMQNYDRGTSSSDAKCYGLENGTVNLGSSWNIAPVKHARSSA
ncbi:hypothetical protein LOAG_04223 [Loa loa]|uniref:Uncharacterized protein n=1 Tax=Loa loa TaxID=7209 RepID=A0A1S0U2C2_LOALO|nr:hypothetical protein LOAG_04223 [Loa loa]EFO24263.1 hypothetical protein LOAG_04223 [Loa loa]